MYKEQIKVVLSKVRKNKITIDKAIEKLKNLPYEDLGFAKIDHHRAIRKGFPEVIFCEGKTKEQIVQIIRRMQNMQNNVLATRAGKEIYNAVKKEIPNAEYNEIAKTIIIKKFPIARAKNKFVGKFFSNKKKILVISAGTSDIPVAEEAAVTAELLGGKVERIYDVGVAGIHRLLSHKEKIRNADVLIVVAGMDGVLPSVVSGLVDKPLIAVPTSIGYGASFKGIGALLTMLNCCSPGVVVVNIDNGFGAGYFAGLMNK